MTDKIITHMRSVAEDLQAKGPLPLRFDSICEAITALIVMDDEDIAAESLAGEASVLNVIGINYGMHALDTFKEQFDSLLEFPITHVVNLNQPLEALARNILESYHDLY